MSEPLSPLSVLCAGSCFAFSGLFYKLYADKRQEVLLLKEIPHFQPEQHLLRVLQASAQKRLHYVAVEGVVQARGETISSPYVPRCQGVVQKITLREHRKLWSARLNSWVSSCTNQTQSSSCVPFSLVQPGSSPGGVSVRVDSPLQASGHYLGRVHTRLRPAREGAVEALVHELSGEKPVALEEWEELLRVGTLLTGFGEVVLEAGGAVRLQPPSDGRSYVLVPGDHRSFIRRHQNSAAVWKALSALFGLTGVAVMGGAVHAALSRDRK